MRGGSIFLGVPTNARRKKQVTRIKPANGLHIDVALFSDVTDRKPDFIHMTQEHNLRRAFAVRAAFAQLRSPWIGCDLIKQPADLRHDQLFDAVFIGWPAEGKYMVIHM